MDLRNPNQMELIMVKVEHPTDDLLPKAAERENAHSENDGAFVIEIEEIPTSGLALMQQCGDSETV